MNELAERQQYEVTQARDVESAVAEVQSAMVIAQKFPRRAKEARHEILNACARPKLAETALYSYRKGGTDITGPSIRLAEVLAQNWGNMSFGLRELVNTPRRGDRMGESQVQAYCWDMQTNTKREITFTVPHIRFKRNGVDILEDPREIYELIANQGARRMRACILAIIPGDIVEEAVEAVHGTLNTSVNLTPEKLQGCLDRFAKFGVSKSQLEAFCQCRWDAVKPTQYTRLVHIWNSLNDGASKASEWFEAEAIEQGDQGAPASRSDALKSKVQTGGGEAPPPGADFDEATGEIEGFDYNQSAGMVADFNAVIEEATTLEQLAAIEVDIGAATGLDAQDQVIVLNGLIKRKSEIEPGTNAR